jgi:hypothetical protein
MVRIFEKDGAWIEKRSDAMPKDLLSPEKGDTQGVIDVYIANDPLIEHFYLIFRPSADQRPCFAWSPSVPGPRFIGYAKVNKKPARIDFEQ